MNDAEASAVTADNAMGGSHSVALVSAVASVEECASLREHAIAVADRERARRQKSGPAYGTDGMRYDGRTGRIRGPVKELLDAGAQELCDAILMRAVVQVEHRLPGLITRLFGEGTLASTILNNDDIVFSPGEPAVNVYTSGGDFDAHTDKQSLTVLVPLSWASEDSGGHSDASACVQSEEVVGFSGGGTAFWSMHDSTPHSVDDERQAQLAGLVSAASSAPEEGRGAPKVVVRPPPGTAIVFGGQMTHAGQPVLGGQRCVLVASFSAKVLVSGDAELRERWATPQSLARR